MRVRPYRTADNRIDGTVLQLLDVSDLKRSMEEVRHARDYAQAIVNTVREPLVVLDQNLAIQNANRAFYDALDLTQGAALGQSVNQVARGRFDTLKVRTLFEQISSGSAQLNDVEIEYQPDRGQPRILSVNARRLSIPDQKQLILLAFEDITERKRAAEARYRRLFESARDGILLSTQRWARSWTSIHLWNNCWIPPERVCRPQALGNRAHQKFAQIALAVEQIRVLGRAPLRRSDPSDEGRPRSPCGSNREPVLGRRPASDSVQRARCERTTEV